MCPPELPELVCPPNSNSGMCPPNSLSMLGYTLDRVFNPRLRDS